MDAIDVNLARLKTAIAVKQRRASLPEPARISPQPEKTSSQAPPAKQPVMPEHARPPAQHGEDDRAPHATNLWGRIRRSFGW
jgi:hypothetical protein